MERERGSAAVAVSGAMKPEISRLKSLKPPIFTAVRRVPVDVGCTAHDDDRVPHASREV